LGLNATYRSWAEIPDLKARGTNRMDTSNHIESRCSSLQLGYGLCPSKGLPVKHPS
jgi:hypothetical protein